MVVKLGLLESWLADCSGGKKADETAASMADCSAEMSVSKRPQWLQWRVTYLVVQSA